MKAINLSWVSCVTHLNERAHNIVVKPCVVLDLTSIVFFIQTEIVYFSSRGRKVAVTGSRSSLKYKVGPRTRM